MTPDGVDRENSLRTVRVVKKGLVFEANLSFGGRGGYEKEAALLKKTAGMVRHMGIGRTRGLGLVKLTVMEAREEESGHSREQALVFTGDRYRIDYSVRLLAPYFLRAPREIRPGASGT